MVRQPRNKADEISLVLDCDDYPTLVEKVKAELCRPDRFDPDRVAIRTKLVKRQGQVCAVYFEMQAMRQVSYQAIWLPERRRVLFYNALGKRMAQAAVHGAINAHWREILPQD
ncbi:MAG: hypothetical protein C4297_10965 [Gemmataceae bacterium]